MRRTREHAESEPASDAARAAASASAPLPPTSTPNTATVIEVGATRRWADVARRSRSASSRSIGRAAAGYRASSASKSAVAIRATVLSRTA